MKYLAYILLFLSFSASAQYNGVNIGEGAFGGNTHKYGYSYRYPSNEEILQAKVDGFNLIRVPFKWERLQPTLNRNLDAFAVGELKRIADYAKSIGLKVLLDLHNYTTYGENKPDGSLVVHKLGEGIGKKEIGVFWVQLASQFKSYDNVMFGIMNEPNKIDAAVWADIQQFVITSIRDRGISNTLYLSGNLWSGASSFTKMQGSTSNALEMEKVVDPYDNYVIEVHQYFDQYSSGTSFTCVSENIGVDRLALVTDWARAKGKKLFLGEFGAGRNDTCYKALEKTLNYMKANNDVWEGWAYWASIEWFGNKYEFNIHHKAVPNATQLKILQGQCY